MYITGYTALKHQERKDFLGLSVALVGTRVAGVPTEVRRPAAGLARHICARAAKKETKEEMLRRLGMDPESAKERLKDDLKRNAKYRMKKAVKDIQEKKQDDTTARQEMLREVEKIKKEIREETEKLITEEFAEAKQNIQADYAAKMELLDESRREQQEKNKELLEELKKEDEAQVEKMYNEQIKPLLESRNKIQALVNEMAEEESSAKRNTGLFFQNLYGPTTKRKDKVLRPQSSEDGKIKFIEDNASDPKELGKVTRSAIEELQAQTEEQAQPFVRAAYSVVTAIILINGFRWLAAHNPFQ
eukprot:CAMPEP_0167793424 /NCGR_PEP_ID=MMETSP0111_2-20121227/13173_1 /TAXON_ID=91324 /ORGANISM="Lotharella globosa, Strain CCCM811" /LENGTH=302 /DNA_ID=CAMNT_0007686581 /DNA_START=79 /DNA_END=987 /DNA_ORIENTATION=-